jgi:hypothetical protein
VEHQITFRGQDTQKLYHHTTTAMAVALVPFGLALSIDLDVALSAAIGPAAATPIALLGVVFIGTAWFGPLALGKRKETMDEGRKPTPVSTKVRQVLTEARVILPGAQALLGFALIATLMEGFAKLPHASQVVHVLSLLSVTVAVVILMMPAAYHRFVERGEETESFYQTASRLVLTALVPLGLAISGGFYVACLQVTGSPTLAAFAAGVLLLGLFVWWFAFPTYRRRAIARRS